MLLNHPQSSELTASPARSILFIDAGLQDATQLIKHAAAGTEVVQLDPSGDEIGQITQTLKGRSNISSVHIVSHGRDGGIELGHSWLDLQSLPSYTAQLKSWGAALTKGADILLYGCNVAQDAAGKGFVNLVAQATGADVAASDNLTGNAALGGDWTLEYSTGKIETPGVFTSAVEAAYQHVLATLTVPSTTTNSTAGGSAVTVAPGLTVSPTTTGETIDGARVAITSNFSSANDRLGITGQSGISGTVNGLSWTYDTSTGILSLAGTAAVATYQTALQQVTYRNTNAADTPAPRAIQFSLGSNLANPGNGHFYNFVRSSGINWFQARDAAAASSYFGLKGYLATVTSGSENAFIASKVQAIGWLGGSNSVDPTNPNSAIGSTWKWVTGPEAGQAFWNGLSTGSAVSGAYSNWDSGEPNNAGGAERYTHIFPNGTWNDYAYSNPSIQGYIVEYGGSSGDPTIQVTGSTTVQVRNNGAPALTGSKATLAAGVEDTAYTIRTSDLLAGYTDPEGDTLSVASLTATNGMLTNNGSTYTFTPSANYNGTINLTYNVVDGNGGSIAATQSFTLAAVNDPVTGAPAATLPAGTEDTPYTVSAATLLQGFSDVDVSRGEQTLSIANLTASNGTVAINGNNFTITPTANYNGAVTLTYNVTDGNGSTLTGQTRSYTLRAVNDPAALTGPKATLNAGTQNETYIIKASDLLVGYTDVEGDPLSVTGLTATNGTLIDNKDGTYTFTPSANFVGTINLNYAVSDGTDNTIATQSFAVQPTYQLTWRNPSTGLSGIWAINGNAEISKAGYAELANGTRLTPDASWRLVSSKFDFNSDGVKDFVWFNTRTTETAIWYMQPNNTNGVANIVANATVVSLPGASTPFRPGGGWQVAAVADLMGDNRPELLWENPIAGFAAIWQLNIGANGQAEIASTSRTLSQNNAAQTPLNYGGNGWKIVGVGNFDGDASTRDVLWFNDRSREVAVWQLNGTTVMSAALLNGDGVKPQVGWKPVAIGNIDATGMDEIVWQRGTEVAIWQVGANFSIGAKTTVLTQALDANEQVQGLVDMNRDGTLDLVVRSKTTPDLTRGWYLDPNSLQLRSMNPTQYITLKGDPTPFPTADKAWDVIDAFIDTPSNVN